MYSNYQYRGIRVDSLFLLPKFADTNSVTNSMKNIHGNLIRVDKKFFYRDTALSKWTELVGSGGGATDTTSLSNRINSKADTSIIQGFVSFSDTITLIATKSDIISPIDTTSLSNRIDGKLSISDTATMLNSYLLKQDTVSLSDRIVLKLNISDTSTMLSPYARANDIDLQFVTDNGGITTNDILAQRFGIYDLFYNNYGLLYLNQEIFYINDSAENVLNFQRGRLGLTKSSGISADLDALSLTTMRTFTFPDTSGTFILNTDTSGMLSTYIRSSIFPIATFGGGSGAAGDTSVFTTDAIYGSFYNAGTDSIVVTSIDTVQRSGSVTTTVYYNTSIDTSGATTVTAGSTIPPARHVWVQTTAITTKPTYYSVTLNGYRKRP
jgi:hypothetical protein